MDASILCELPSATFYCGIDVAKMDTTFADPKSPHNIHFVKWEGCHTQGVPARRSKIMRRNENS